MILIEKWIKTSLKCDKNGAQYRKFVANTSNPMGHKSFRNLKYRKNYLCTKIVYIIHSGPLWCLEFYFYWNCVISDIKNAPAMTNHALAWWCIFISCSKIFNFLSLSIHLLQRVWSIMMPIELHDILFFFNHPVWSILLYFRYYPSKISWFKCKKNQIINIYWDLFWLIISGCIALLKICWMGNRLLNNYWIY